MTRALLITNPVAARMDGDAVRAVRDILQGGGWRAEAKADGFDVLVSFGGDGTAMQVAGALVSSGVPLGIVPGGTGNLLARNLRLPVRPDAAARAMLRGRAVAVDLGAVERPDGTHYFAVACGAGFDAQVMAQTGSSDKQKWKFGAYVVSALNALPALTSIPFEITVDGRTEEVSAAMVLIANCGDVLPPVLNLGKRVRPDDGTFDVIAVRAEGLAGGVAAFFELLRGVGRGTTRVWSARGRDIAVAVAPGGAPQLVEMDGENAGETPFAARLLPGALRVLGGPSGRKTDA
jgi:diacylglycerol kinase family enzyme